MLKMSKLVVIIPYIFFGRKLDKFWNDKRHVLGIGSADSNCDCDILNLSPLVRVTQSAEARPMLHSDGVQPVALPCVIREILFPLLAAGIPVRPIANCRAVLPTPGGLGPGVARSSSQIRAR